METYHGHVRTPADAIILFEACRLGTLPRVQRRLSEKERQSIKSGSVFVWDEREAGMRRWTDGKSWSASRVSGSFLTYREMEGKRGGSNYAAPLSRAGRTPDSTRGSDSDVDMGAGDEGPDGYRYKPDGLMKQSFSITTSTGNHLHLISYYSRASPQASQLQQPSNDPSLRHIRPPKGMYPESTVQEHSSIPAVTRSPMPGQIPMQGAPAYAGRGGPSPAAGYVDPHMYPRPWPGQSTTSVPNGYVPYPPNPVAPGAPSYAPAPQAYGHPIPPLPQPAAATSAPAFDPSLPRPAVPTHHRSNSGSSLGPGSYPSSRPSPHSGVSSLVPPTSASRQHSQNTSPACTPPLRQVDPRLMVPGANSLPPVRGDRLEGAARTPSPLPGREWPGPPISRDGAGTTSGSIPSIGVLMNGAKEHMANGGQSGSGSPGYPRAEGPQDIPHDKLGFGEDMRALRVLDRAFKT